MRHTTKLVIIVCDCCGDEIKADPGNEIVIVVNDVSYDLCNPCSYQFDRIIKFFVKAGVEIYQHYQEFLP